MKTVSFKLPAELDDALTKLARARNTSRSSLVREALAAYAVAGRASVTASVDAITSGVNGPRDLSSNPKHMARYGK
ncbi:MAG TPA: CopG family transcriptional regulator [Gemmatimonadaceae bacterium]|jgi:predicted transcriptional regulator|nr:CopG family transcriptional regulator [Gemmatimonadaceae bacterium]